jgi:hypothetical protein
MCLYQTAKTQTSQIKGQQTPVSSLLLPLNKVPSPASSKPPPPPPPQTARSTPTRQGLNREMQTSLMTAKTRSVFLFAFHFFKQGPSCTSFPPPPPPPPPKPPDRSPTARFVPDRDADVANDGQTTARVSLLFIFLNKVPCCTLQLPTTTTTTATTTARSDSSERVCTQTGETQTSLMTQNDGPCFRAYFKQGPLKAPASPPPPPPPQTA